MGDACAMIKREQWFTFRETEDFKKIVIIPKNYDKFPMNTKNGGSYAIAPARVLGYTFPDYLRFLTTMFPEDVEIVGKGKMYPTVYWRRGKVATAFLQLLNLKLSLAMGNENG